MIDDNARVGGEPPIGTNAAALVESTRDKVGAVEPDRVFIGSRLSGDLTQDDVVAFERRDRQGRPALGLAEVREGKVENDNVVSYKLAQAASSSGVSQSLASDDSAASAGTRLSAWVSLSDRRNARSLSRSCSGMRSNSLTISSRLLIAFSV